MIEAVNLVLNHAPAEWSAPTRLVAIAIADRVNRHTMRCWPSIGDIGARTGLSDRQVQRHLRVIEDAGWIARHPSRQGVSNLWTWCGQPRLGVSWMTPRGVTYMTPPALTEGVTCTSPKPLLLTTTREPGAAAL